MMRRALPFALGLAASACAAGESELDAIEAPPSLLEVRPDTPGNNLQFNFERADLVETFASSDGRFLIHFTRNGPNAVPAADADTSGVPDFVEQVASVYVDVLAFYEGLGFRPPESDAAIADNGGDDKFDVYLVDFAGVGDGAFRQDACLSQNPDRCIGFMTQENDYTGYGYPSTLVANRILGSHEFFHAIQAAYDADQGSVFAEGTAVWATEAFDPSLNDFEYFVAGYLENVDRPLDSPLPGPVDPFSYGSALFFQFLDEAYGREVILALFERVENGANGNADPQWVAELDGALGEAGATFPEAMVEFATWNLYTDDYGDPAKSYANGGAYDRAKIETVQAPFSDDEIRSYYASSQYRAVPVDGRSEMTAALVSSDPAELEGLRLIIATEANDSIDHLLLSDPTAGTETIDTSAGGRFVFAVVNTAIEGDSKQPGLCAGTPDEVASCAQALLGGGGGGAGAGGGDAGGAGGAGGRDDAEDDGCGCRIVGEAHSPEDARALFLALAAMLALRPRKRKLG